MDISVT